MSDKHGSDEVSIANQKCDNCRYYFKALNGCRAHSPQVFMVSVKVKDPNMAMGAPNNLDMLTLSSFPSPPQGENDWCGEWLPNDTVVLN